MITMPGLANYLQHPSEEKMIDFQNDGMYAGYISIVHYQGQSFHGGWTQGWPYIKVIEQARNIFQTLGYCYIIESIQFDNKYFKRKLYKELLTAITAEFSKLQLVLLIHLIDDKMDNKTDEDIRLSIFRIARLNFGELDSKLFIYPKSSKKL